MTSVSRSQPRLITVYWSQELDGLPKNDSLGWCKYWSYSTDMTNFNCTNTTVFAHGKRVLQDVWRSDAQQYRWYNLKLHLMGIGGSEPIMDGYVYTASICIIWWLIKIPLSGNGHSSRIKMLLSRNFRELYVYLSRGPCWPTTPLLKIHSPPAKLRQRITDHFLIAFWTCS